MSEYTNLLIGLAFVLFYAQQRFATPVTNRCSTTAERYFLAMGLYGLLMGAAYLLVAQFPHLIGFVTHGGDVSGMTGLGASTSLHVALLFTVLLPKIPILKQVDQALLKFTQDLANIPFGVRCLCERLRKAEAHLTPEQIAAVEEEQQRLGIVPAQVATDQGRHLLRRWKETAALYLSVRQWESDPRMAGFVELFQNDWQALREQYDQVSGKLRDALGMLGERTTVSLREGNREFSSRFQKLAGRFQEDCVGLLDLLRGNILGFVGRGVFHSEPTCSSRERRLASLGYSLPPVRKGLDANQITFLIGAIAVVFVAFSVAFSRGNRPMEDVLVMSILIALKYGLSIVCVVLPKAWWAFARHTPGRTRPWMFYLLASLVAVGFSLVCSLAMGAWMADGWAEGTRRFFTGRCPWLLMTLGTAWVTAVLVDMPRKEELRGAQRWIEGGALALAFVLFGLLTYVWLQSNHTAPDNLAFFLAKVASTGLLIGATVPSWYRDSEQTRRKNASEPLLVGAHTAVDLNMAVDVRG